MQQCVGSIVFFLSGLLGGLLHSVRFRPAPPDVKGEAIILHIELHHGDFFPLAFFPHIFIGCLEVLAD